MIAQLGIARRVAKYGNTRMKVAAIAFTPNGTIITKAHNRKVLGIPGKWTEHAEASLLHKLNKIQAWNRFDNIIILVIRVRKIGIAMAKPCSKCQRILGAYPVTVFYTNEIGDIEKLK